MLQLAIPFGRWFGVHLRVHISFLLLLALSAGYSTVATGSMLRGIGLWLALVAAVITRELARAIAAAYAGAPLRALFLLPFGGVMALEARDGGLSRSSQRLIALTGALANLAAALLLLGFAYGIDPAVSLFRQPWIGVDHILRSAVWLQAGLGVVNLLPTNRLALPGWFRGRLPQSRRAAASADTSGTSADPNASAAPGALPGLSAASARLPLLPRRPALGIATALSLALILSGFLLQMLWPVLLGITWLFISYVGRLASLGGADAGSITVRDVMLTEFATLPASGTLRDALRRASHTLQDTFPVVRGDRLVGWISRSQLAFRLQAEGDTYLQGVMTRSLQFAEPGEKLSDAWRRAAALGASEFIPVVEDGAMIGMLTPHSLERAIGQIRLTRPQPERSDA